MFCIIKWFAIDTYFVSSDSLQYEGMYPFPWIGDVGWTLNIVIDSFKVSLHLIASLFHDTIELSCTGCGQNDDVISMIHLPSTVCSC